MFCAGGWEGDASALHHLNSSVSMHQTASAQGRQRQESRMKAGDKGGPCSAPYSSLAASASGLGAGAGSQRWEDLALAFEGLPGPWEKQT